MFVFDLCARPLAYIDPGTGGIILQLIIAGLVGTAVFFRQAIVRFFSLFSRKNSDKPAANAESPE